MREVAALFKSLGDENRLRIFMMLAERPMCVCEINAVLNVALSTISAHLKNLKYARLIEDSKEGRWVVYRLAENDFALSILNLLKSKLADDEVFRNDTEKVKKISREDLVC
ncbi:ArsR/SmtB family transcription factor [Flexistipes sp.]|uniref:ArsR/SmtB family transcription factor n=1 Tax=Flexistipes sp. TaxID=3088135 RepID=UPI002E1D69AD|nr:metalloregulator ArsR/SmtB family transcription factor [Flexistipes sp.]